MATEKPNIAVEEPLSPGSRLFHSPQFNCAIIVTFGCKIRTDPNVVIDGLKHTLINHPRFSSKLEMERGNREKPVWVRTKVRVEDHVVVPDIDPNMEDPDQFLENYTSNLTALPMDMSKPLWEIHIFNLKTSDAESVSVLKIHHSLGDGMSLMSLFLACTRQTSDPEALPTVAVKKRRIGPSNSLNVILRFVVRFWLMIRLILNTCIDVCKFAATLFLLRDTETPIMSKTGDLALNPRRCVYRIISFEDVKLVKNAMKMTINDVLLGVTHAGLSRYISRRYDQEGASKSKQFMRRIRLHSAIMINLRPNTGIEALADMMAKGSKCRWGNLIGYILLPFSIGLENDPLEYVRRAKATIDRKKLSLEGVFSYAIFKFTMNVIGFKAGEALVRRVFDSTTMTFSNVVGPKEEISFYGHPISYFASSAFGHPHALSLHFQSYANKLIISMAVDPTVIPDAHRLCDDLEESLKIIKSTVLERGLCNVEV